MVIETNWVIMRNEGHVKNEEKSRQVYACKDMDFDRVCEMTSWLNKSAQGGFYWVKEVQNESTAR